LIGNVLVDKGDTVLMENPTFPNVHSIFRSLQAEIRAMPVDNNGIMLKSLPRQEQARLKVIHTTPSHHYPTGIRMSLERRKALLAYANKHKCMIIENDYEHELANWRAPLPALFSMDQQDRVIFMGTFNRLLHPSVRLGYMVVPFLLIDAVAALQMHSHRFVSPASQIVMNQFIEKKYLYQHIKEVIQVAAERKALFLDLFNHTFTDEIRIQSLSTHSLYLLAKMNQHISDKAVTHALKQKNIIAHRYSKCFIDGYQEQGLILGYASVRRPILIKTLNQMAHIWHTQFHP